MTGKWIQEAKEHRETGTLATKILKGGREKVREFVNDRTKPYKRGN